jgi:hypothetical protein
MKTIRKIKWGENKSLMIPETFNAPCYWPAGYLIILNAWVTKF